MNPLSAYPLARVVDLFKENCDLSSLGVKDQPTLTVAFEILIERKNEILRSHDWTCAVFSYLKKIDGLNVQFKEEIAKLAFIPLAGSHVKNHLQTLESQLFSRNH